MTDTELVPYVPLLDFNAMVIFAINQVVPKIEYFPSIESTAAWRAWADQWVRGENRTPGAAVQAAHSTGVHALKQIAWAAKEAYYTGENPQAGWLVLRYIADAMIDFGVSGGSHPKEKLTEWPANNRLAPRTPGR